MCLQDFSRADSHFLPFFVSRLDICYYLPPQVARLYRKSLRVLLSWSIHRHTFNEESAKLRQRFEDARGCNSAKAANLLRVSSEVVIGGCLPS